MTFNVVCDSWACNGHETCVGRARHLDARSSWLQQLCAEGVMETGFRPGENQANLESKMVDSTSLFKGRPLRPPLSWSSWMVAASFPRSRGSVNLELVPDRCGNGHRDPDGVVRRTIWDLHFR